jgi:hypothetical protein
MPTNVTAPEWLTRHGGAVRPAVGHGHAVLIDGAPQYLLVPTPATGKFGCKVEQTINGRRLDSGATYATEDDAVRGGLEDLRKALGW